ncbi:MAG: hypothetical protein M0R74_14280 [Dehalococcoidia bacterium]|nr:hypothetical protein [Dehalococcoidia bacterium]
MQSPDEQLTLKRITQARAEVLREISAGYTLQESAARLGMGFNGIRSVVRDPKEITGAESVPELRRWWDRRTIAWLQTMARSAGVRLPDPVYHDEGTRGT